MTYLILLLLFSLLVINIPLFIKYKKNSLSNVIEFFVIVIYILLVAFRPIDIIPDTFTYNAAFSTVGLDNLSFDFFSREPRTGMEYGFVYLMLVFKYFGFSFYSFTSLISLFSLLSIHCFVRFFLNNIIRTLDYEIYKCRFLYIFGSYMVYFGLFYNLVTIRALLAIDFLLFCAIFAFQKKVIKTFLFLFLAFIIHRMAIIGFIIIFVFLRRKSILSFNKFRFFVVFFFIVFFLEYNFHFLKSLFFLLMSPILEIFHYTNYAIKKSDSGIGRFLQVLFWLIHCGLVYLILFRQYKHRIPLLLKKVLGVYLIGVFIAVSFCNYDSAYRIFDFFVVFSIPINCYLICLPHKSFSYMLFIANQNLFLLIPFRTFCMYYLFQGHL